MKIAFICPLIPYPLTDGGRKAVFYPLKYLANRGHEITIFCTSEKMDQGAISELSQFCKVEVTLNDKQPKVMGAIRSLGSRTPYIFQRFHNKAHLDKIIMALQGGFDLVQAEGIHAAYYGTEIKKRFDIPVILRLVNLESENLATYTKHYSNLLIKQFLRLEVVKMRYYEANNASLFDRVLTVTDIDESKLKSLAPSAKTTVVPGGVDLHHFEGQMNEEIPFSILWMGALQWGPNQDSFWWFFNKILPLIVARNSRIKLTVVGSNPTQQIRDIAHPNVDIVGYVPDVRPYIAQAQVCVIPLRAGSGIRMKLLEMFAMKKVVVSTSLGCEGIGAVNRQHLLIADSELKFAEAVLEFFGNEALRKQCGLKGYELVRDKFSWERITDQYEYIYKELICR